MGVYSTVEFSCPRCGCEGTVRFQTNAGERECMTFQPWDIPPEVAADISGDSTSCEDCGETYTALAPDSVPVTLV